MDLSRVGRGEMIAGISGIVLIIVMFLNWYSVPGVPDLTGIEGFGFEGPDASVNAWQAHGLSDIIWFVTGAAAIGLALLAATQTRVNLPVAASAIVTALGALSLILIVIQLIDPPGGLSREYGIFLGLLAILGITYGGWAAMQDEGTSLGEQARGIQDRVGSGDDEPPSSPPPPPPSQPPSGGGPTP